MANCNLSTQSFDLKPLFFSVTDIGSALSLSEEDFSSKYGFPKPGQSESLVTHCKVGGRAAKAADALKAAGYGNVRVYSGSMEDWKKNQGEIVTTAGASGGGASKSCSMV